MALHEFVIENKSHATQKQHAGRTHKIAKTGLQMDLRRKMSFLNPKLKQKLLYDSITLIQTRYFSAKLIYTN